MKLSVIIVNYNHRYFPRLAVEALEKSVTDFPFEIIVVDNASREKESVTFLEKAHFDKRLTFLKLPKNIGFGQGNNAGARLANGKYIYIHNPDTTLPPDALQKMVDYMEKHADIGILAPKLVYSGGEIQASCRRDLKLTDLLIKRTPLRKIPLFRRKLRQYLMEDFDHQMTQEVDLVTGAAMMLPRNVYEKVGGFDKRYFLFMEDFDLCKEVRKAGYKVVYHPDVAINHFHKRLSDGNLFKLISKPVFWHHVINAIKYTLKWKGK